MLCQKRETRALQIMDETKWHFWIDVGGTFTDCFDVTPSENLLRHKLLSSGKTKGIAGPQSTTQIVVDAARVGITL